MPMWQNMVALQLSNLEPYEKIDLQFLNPRFKFPEEKNWSAQLGSCVCSLPNSSNPVQGEQWHIMQTWLPETTSVITLSCHVYLLHWFSYFITSVLKGIFKDILCNTLSYSVWRGIFCSSSLLYCQKLIDYVCNMLGKYSVLYQEAFLCTYSPPYCQKHKI